MSWAPGWYGWDPDSEDAAAWGPFSTSSEAKGHPDPFAHGDEDVRVFYVSMSDTPRHRDWANEVRQRAVWVDGPDSEAARAARAARGGGSRMRDLVKHAARYAGRGEEGAMPRWSAVGYVFGLGSTSATALCRELGLDPDEEMGNTYDGEGCDVY